MAIESILGWFCEGLCYRPHNVNELRDEGGRQLALHIIYQRPKNFPALLGTNTCYSSDFYEEISIEYFTGTVWATQSAVRLQTVITPDCFEKSLANIKLITHFYLEIVEC